MRVKVMDCGEQPSGRVYATGVMEKAAEEFMKRNFRPVYIEESAPDTVINELSRVAGVVNNMEMDGDTLYADISLMGTPDGQIAKTLLFEAPGSVEFGVRGVGEFIDEKVVNKFELLSIDLIKKQ